MALLSSCFAMACGGGGLPPGTPNLVVVVVDTLRADHVGAYGYARPTTPRFDALAGSATLFTRAVASAPWTLPSHASMFTGLDPFEHGAHSYLTHRPGRNAYPLDSNHPTLAAELQAAGFATGAFTANIGYLGAWTGLDRGFDVYQPERGTGLSVNERAFRWLDSTPERPFFLFLNYMDCHRPYNTEPVTGFEPAAERDKGLLDQLVDLVLGTDDPIPDDLVRRVIAQYDNGIANADLALGDLLDGLAHRGRLHDTLVVVTSDHGEFFGEHRLTEHSKDVYQAVLWVPLLIREVGQGVARRVETPVSLAHLPHLIAERMGPLAPRLTARFGRAPGDRPVLAENYYTRTKDLRNPIWGPRFHRIRRSVLDWPYKRIASSDGRNELYDLASDPLEERDLQASDPRTGARLDAWLDALLAEGGQTATRRAAQPSEQELEELRALGYVE